MMGSCHDSGWQWGHADPDTIGNHLAVNRKKSQAKACGHLRKRNLRQGVGQVKGETFYF
jgi:hypothetical protein